VTSFDDGYEIHEPTMSVNLSSMNPALNENCDLIATIPYPGPLHVWFLSKYMCYQCYFFFSFFLYNILNVCQNYWCNLRPILTVLSYCQNVFQNLRLVFHTFTNSQEICSHLFMKIYHCGCNQCPPQTVTPVYTGYTGYTGLHRLHTGCTG